MIYDFDRIVDRRGTNSLKYDFSREYGKGENVLPLWVADMDFQTAPEILESLEKTVHHGIFGYSEVKEEYFLAVKRWYWEHFEWKVERSWLVKAPGVVFALATAIRAFTREGDAVLIQRPVYYPFSEVINNNDRVLVNSPLKQVGSHYEIDFEDLENKICAHQVKLFLLCSPHNPVGRVWQERELHKLGEICLRHNVVVVSDEIHSDFTYEGYAHHVFAKLSKELSDITITCTAPSKTFNMAGLQVSNIFISNPKLRAKFKKVIEATGYSQLNLIGLVACQAAYEKGGPWLKALKEYLAENLAFVREYLRERLPEIKLIEPEGTHLIWLDFRELGMTEAQRENLIVNKAGLWLDSGIVFGAEGKGYERINIACPREVLRQALEQLEEALKGR